MLRAVLLREITMFSKKATLFNDNYFLTFLVRTEQDIIEVIYNWRHA
ncbi:hypothetical protein HMPREF9519_01463 [Enterococcus faecalis TX1346]|nr:hypothetical protein HMPREF9519_01463 [Enterococcus faecalis TX1346]